MSKRAWVTLATNDSYALGALVLAESLRRAGSAYPIVVLVTPSITDVMRERLSAKFAEVITVDVLDSKDAAHLALLARPELGITFTKIHCWSLIQYEKCVFLDADTLVIQNCDELFEREELSAAPDVGWPDCFNSGVFVYKPSQETFDAIIKFAQERGSFDGGDQGLLNSFFSDWARGDISKHLPFLYNVTSAAIYSYIPALKYYGQDMKIIHFIGNAKPWLQHYNWQSKSIDSPEYIREYLQLWWSLFVESVHSHLDTGMSGVAGNLARITPGDPEIQHEVIDELTRRQGWEAGNIDYMGADSFDNIWAKIAQTLAEPRSSPTKQPSPPKEVTPPSKQSSPPPVSEKPKVPEAAPLQSTTSDEQVALATEAAQLPPTTTTTLTTETAPCPPTTTDKQAPIPVLEQQIPVPSSPLSLEQPPPVATEPSLAPSLVPIPTSKESSIATDSIASVSQATVESLTEQLAASTITESLTDKKDTVEIVPSPKETISETFESITETAKCSSDDKAVDSALPGTETITDSSITTSTPTTKTPAPQASEVQVPTTPLVISKDTVKSQVTEIQKDLQQSALPEPYATCTLETPAAETAPDATLLKSASEKSTEIIPCSASIEQSLTEISLQPAPSVDQSQGSAAPVKPELSILPAPASESSPTTTSETVASEGDASIKATLRTDTSKETLPEPQIPSATAAPPSPASLDDSSSSFKSVSSENTLELSASTVTGSDSPPLAHTPSKDDVIPVPAAKCPNRACSLM